MNSPAQSEGIKGTIAAPEDNNDNVMMMLDTDHEDASLPAKDDEASLPVPAAAKSAAKKIPAAKGKASVTTPRQRRRKKPKDMPRRPLSAYNLFFRSERTRILAQLAEAADDNNKDVTALPTDYSSHSKEALHRLKGSSGPAKFQAMAKTIAQRWRALTEPEREPYEAKAAVELTAYQKRKDDYHRNLVRQSDDFWTEGKQPATTTASEATASVLDYSKNQDDSSRSGWTPTAVDPLMGMTLMGSMSPTREGTIPYASLSSLMMGGGMGLPTLSSLTGSSLADSRFAASFSRLTSPASFLRLPPASSHMASLFGSGSVGGVNPGLLLLQQRQQQREQEDSMLRAALLSQHQQQQQLQQRDDMLMQAQNHHQQREQQDLVFRLQAAEELLQQRQEAAAQQSHAESQFRVDPQALARLSPEDRRLVLMRMLEGGGAQGSLGDFRR